jgi:hypothetical protein
MSTKFNFLFYFSVLSIISSCTVSKKSTNDKEIQIVKTNKTTETKVEVPIKKDTTIVVKTSESNESDISFVKPDFKKIYNLSIILPLKNDDINDKYNQYLGGVKVGAKQLEREGVNLNIEVLNAYDPLLMERIKNKNNDLICAPQDDTQIKFLNEFSKEKKISLVSPFLNLSNVSPNPYLIQLIPSLKSHYSAILEDIHSMGRLTEAVVIGRENKSDRTIMDYIKMSGDSYSDKVIEEVINENNISFIKLINQGKRIFIFPNFSFKDEIYLNTALKILNAQKGKNKIVVYGMSVLKDNDQISVDLLSNFQLRIPTTKFVDFEQLEIKDFNVEFLENFGAIPTNDSYEGHDHILFVGRTLKEFGRNFQLYKSVESDYYFQSAFSIQPYLKTTTGAVEYYENKHISILELKGQKFVRINN